MQSQGLRVKIVVPATEESVTFKTRCDAVGVECERSKMIVADMEGTGQRFSQLLRLLPSLDGSLLHFHTGNSCLPRSVMLALEVIRSRPAFATLQSPYETITPGGARARFWAVSARRRLLAVASPSAHGTEFQLRCGIPPRLAVTIRNCVDVAAYASGDPRGPRRSLGLADGAPIVLSTSRIEGQKRPIDALRIFASVAHQFPSAVLAFVGGGEDEMAVEREAAELGLADRVRLVGYQTNIADWLACATVWLLPTERENFSVAVLEALAAGCPILSTVCPGNDEILVDGVNAFTFPVGDVHAAAGALRRLLANDELRAGLRSGARAAAESYSIDRMVEEYRALYGRAGPLPTALLR
jgi:glycosyltransferase involved in cell wall biosynthesis